LLLPSDQRRLLGAFLRARREALAPNPLEVGRGERRRTPGLRREEVAQRAGLSTTWYTWLEQGRDIALSTEALARLAGALLLSSAERAYLFELTRRRDPAPKRPAGSEAVPAFLLDLLQATAVPAYLLDRRWQVVAHNDSAAELFAPWFESGEPCLLRYVFLHPGAGNFIADWEDRAGRLAAEFRADVAQDPADAEVRALVADLLAKSPAFGRLWNNHTVLSREGGLRVFRSPEGNLSRYEQSTLVPAAHPRLRFVTLLPR
jgi:transcriptional regulator with XRE-family HTH domain